MTQEPDSQTESQSDTFQDFTLVHSEPVPDDFEEIESRNPMAWVPDFENMVSEIEQDAVAWVAEQQAWHGDQRDCKLVSNLLGSLRAACQSGSLRAVGEAVRHLKATLSKRWGL